MNRFLAGVGRALLFKDDRLIGVAKTLTESTFAFDIASEEIRAGAGNALFGKYFHDSNLTVTLTDAMFKLEYIAASLGVDIEMGGINVYESAKGGETVAQAGKITLSKTPVAFDGSLIGWYKKPNEEEWKVGTIVGNTMTVSGAKTGEVYCVKYFYQDDNVKQITIPTQYVPSELHVVIISDLYNGDIAKDLSNTTKAGRVITDIPRLQMDGSQNLALNATGAASINLTGSALAVGGGDSCEEELTYGTMTEEIFGGKWQDNVVDIAVENGDIELATGETQTLNVRVIYGGNMVPQRKPNKDFTFTVDSGTSAQVSNVGVISTKESNKGDTYIKVSLTGKPNVGSAIVKVTVK